MVADPETYLADIIRLLRAQWPGNRTVNIVCHGHSVPAGYFETPLVSTFDAYPHLLHRGLKERFPWAVVNVIVTAIGGENSERGAGRFEAEVLCHRPDVLLIDYGLNDRGIGLDRARAAWEMMIAAAIERDAKVVLLTPTADIRGYGPEPGQPWQELVAHAQQIRELANRYALGLVDSFGAFARYASGGGQLGDLMSHVNHPNRRGHELVTAELLRWFVPND